MGEKAKVIDVVTLAQARELHKQRQFITLLQHELQEKKETISDLQDEIARLKYETQEYSRHSS